MYFDFVFVTKNTQIKMMMKMFSLSKLTVVATSCFRTFRLGSHLCELEAGLTPLPIRRTIKIHSFYEAGSHIYSAFALRIAHKMCTFSRQCGWELQAHIYGNASDSCILLWTAILSPPHYTSPCSADPQLQRRGSADELLFLFAQRT